MVFQKSILKKIITTDTNRPSSPQIQFDNPLDDDIFINGIELILTPEFSLKGKLLILINEVAVFNENASSQFRGYGKFPIPLGKILRRSNDIQVFGWNDEDSNSIEVSINFALSKELLPFNAQAEVISQELVNQVVSKSESIFALASRAIGSFTKLIDMEGYRKIIIALNKSTPETPISTKDILGWNVNPTDLDKSHDGLLSTVSTDGDIIGAGNFGEVTWEWATQKVRNIQVRGNYQGSDTLVTGTLRIFTSTDGIIFTQRFIDVDFDPNGAKNVDIGSFDLKFVKVEIEVTFNQGSNRIRAKWTEVFDKNQMGGTGALSFEVLNNSVWNPFITSSEFGTITDGDNAVIEQIGDVITKSISGKTYALPSTQTNFRAKYTITGDGLTNSVDLLKVQ